MLLLDTSVWIDMLRGNDTAAVRFAAQREPFEELALTSMTYLEVLQGARTVDEMDRLGQLLRTYALLEPGGWDTYESAARLYMTARRQGITIRTAVDCLVAAVAIEHEVVLLHNDRDFLELQKVEPLLQLMPSMGVH